MASLISAPGKKQTRWTVFVTVAGKRHAIRLGGMQPRQADRALEHIEALVVANLDGSAPRVEQAQWLAKLDPAVRRRIAKAGLCEPDAGADLTLGELVDRFTAQKFPGFKLGTVQNHERAFRSIKAHWGASTRIRILNAGACERLRDVLLNVDGLAEATVRKRCSIANKLLRFAIRNDWLDRNPFERAEGVPLGNRGTDKLEYVPTADAEAVLEHLPDTQWQLLFVLSRWGGLRVGSEPRLLCWRDVNWEKPWLVVRSPKTERYAGHAERRVPLWPEVQDALRDRLEVAEAHGEAAPDDLVLPFLRGRTDASLRKTVIRAIENAGLPVWARLWHNLRASRQSELTDEFGFRKVCRWMGNSKEVAMRNYSTPATDADYQNAVARTAKKAQQKAQHFGGSPSAMGQKRRNGRSAKTPRRPLKSAPSH